MTSADRKTLIRMRWRGIARAHGLRFPRILPEEQALIQRAVLAGHRLADIEVTFNLGRHTIQKLARAARPSLLGDRGQSEPV